MLYSILVCFINQTSAFEPNQGTKSANMWICVRGIISPKRAPPAQVTHLRTNNELAGSGKGPDLVGNLGLTCRMMSKHCTYARNISKIGWVNPFDHTTLKMSLNYATQ